MNVLYCKNCHMRTPRNFADEDQFDGVFCKHCATALGYTPKRPNPPTSGSNAIQPPRPRPEIIWAHNLEALKAFALGDPEDPETMLRYWKAQESAGYPGASENVKYFTSIIKSHKAPVSAERVDALSRIVRCRDCKHRVAGTKMCAHPKAIGWDAIEPDDDDFCSCGEKKEAPNDAEF